jgi:hypothetical protein
MPNSAKTIVHHINAPAKRHYYHDHYNTVTALRKKDEQETQQTTQQTAHHRSHRALQGTSLSPVICANGGPVHVVAILSPGTAPSSKVHTEITKAQKHKNTKAHAQI